MGNTVCTTYLELLLFVNNDASEITFVDGGCARAAVIGVKVVGASGASCRFSASLSMGLGLEVGRGLSLVVNLVPVSWPHLPIYLWCCTTEAHQPSIELGVPDQNTGQGPGADQPKRRCWPLGVDPRHHSAPLLSTHT